MKYFSYKNIEQEPITERNKIQELWVIDCIENPERSEFIVDDSGEKNHYYKRIPEFDHRVLEVVTSNSTPKRIITFYFNRNMKKNYDYYL